MPKPLRDEQRITQYPWPNSFFLVYFSSDFIGVEDMDFAELVFFIWHSKSGGVGDGKAHEEADRVIKDG